MSSAQRHISRGSDSSTAWRLSVGPWQLNADPDGSPSAATSGLGGSSSAQRPSWFDRGGSHRWPAWRDRLTFEATEAKVVFVTRLIISPAHAADPKRAGKRTGEASREAGPGSGTGERDGKRGGWRAGSGEWTAEAWSGVQVSGVQVSGVQGRGGMLWRLDCQDGPGTKADSVARLQGVRYSGGDVVAVDLGAIR